MFFIFVFVDSARQKGYLLGFFFYWGGEGSLPLPSMPSDNFNSNAYGLSKSGLIYMTKMMARQAGSLGIRVNAIAPGVTMSEATKKIVPEFALTGLKESAPLGTTLEPEDLAGTAVYLASDDSRLMTGQTLVVDAGVWMNG